MPLSHAKAIDLYREGIYWESASCAFELAGMYERGYGLPVDREEAIRLYRMAAEHGHISAGERLDTLLSE